MRTPLKSDVMCGYLVYSVMMDGSPKSLNNGKDYLVVQDGTLTINAQGDGLKSDEADICISTVGTSLLMWVAMALMLMAPLK